MEHSPPPLSSSQGHLGKFLQAWTSPRGFGVIMNQRLWAHGMSSPGLNPGFPRLVCYQHLACLLEAAARFGYLAHG